MNLQSIIAVVFLVFGFATAVKLPAYFSACKRDDSFDQCVVEQANKGASDLVKGDASVHVVPLNPLHVSEMFIDVGGNLKINITNADILGLEDIKFEYVKWDWENKKVHFNVRIADTKLIGDYDIEGRILILPINGKGPCNITFINGLFKFEVDYEIEERKDKEYINLLNGNMNYEVDRAYFKLDNLFNGDQRLGNEMNKFLDENWKDVNNEIGARVGDALAKIFTSVIKSFFNRVPIKDLWVE